MMSISLCLEFTNRFPKRSEPFTQGAKAYLFVGSVKENFEGVCVLCAFFLAMCIFNLDLHLLAF